MIITIDGPAGSGKSTAARGLAARLAIPYLDTGAMYRAAALAAIRAGVELNDTADPAAPSALAAVVAASDIRLESRPQAAGQVGQPRVFLDGQDVTEQIRSAEISQKSSLLARAPTVRAVLVARQRQIGLELGSLVSEGRDQGSVVFPDADVKFFLDASPQVRAQRRYEEMRAAGQTVPFQTVLDQILTRDQADRSRTTGPLRVPDGAIQLDTSQMTAQEVIDRLADYVAQAPKRNSPSLGPPSQGAGGRP